jgi:hypothetical protein
MKGLFHLLLLGISSAIRITPDLNLSIATDAHTSTSQLETVLTGTGYYQSNLKPCRTGYDLDLDQNLIRAACANGLCRLTCACAADCSEDDCADECTTNPEPATDNSIYTAANVPYNSQLKVGSFTATLPAPSQITRVYLKIYTRVNFTLVLLDQAGRNVTIPTARLVTSFSGSVTDEYDITTLLNETATVYTAIIVAMDCSAGDCSTSSLLNIQEVGVFAGRCFETYSIDLGANYILSAVKLQWYLNTIHKLQVQFSLDSTFGYYDQETDVITNPSYDLSSYVEDITSAVSPPKVVRYIRIKSYVKTSATVWKEINIEGERFFTDSTTCPKACSGHGACAKTGSEAVFSCQCETDSMGDSYQGADCSVKSCEGKCGESEGFGTCNGDVCECSAGRHGSSCSKTLRCPHGCYGHGECNLGVCNCTSLFYGAECGCQKIFELGYGQQRLSDNANVTTNMIVDAVTRVAQTSAKTLLIDGERAPQWASTGVCSSTQRRFYVPELNALLGACALGLCSASCECNQVRAVAPSTYSFYTCSSQHSQRKTPYDNAISFIDGATDGNSV